MIKALSAIACAAFIATALTVLPALPRRSKPAYPRLLPRLTGWTSARSQGLLAAGLAEFRGFLPARGRHQGGADPRARLVTADRTP